jgi:WD40 repeat protein
MLWDLSTKKIISKYDEHKGCVSSISISQPKTTFLSCSTDQNVKFWEIKSKKSIFTVLASTGEINKVKFLPKNGNCFISGGDDSFCKLFDLRNLKNEVAIYCEPKITVGVTAMDLCDNERDLIVGYDDGTIIQYDILKFEKKLVFNFNKKRITCLEINENNKKIAASSFDSTIKILNLES